MLQIDMINECDASEWDQLDHVYQEKSILPPTNSHHVNVDADDAPAHNRLHDVHALLDILPLPFSCANAEAFPSCA